jgi:hypothetical protein
MYFKLCYQDLLFDLWLTWIRENLPDDLLRQLGRMSVSEGPVQRRVLDWLPDVSLGVRFRTGGGGARAAALLSGKNWDVLTLAATRSGSWMTGTAPDMWRKERRQQPVRLLLTCRREGRSPWLVPLEVHPEYPKTAKVRMIDY